MANIQQKSHTLLLSASIWCAVHCWGGQEKTSLCFIVVFEDTIVVTGNLNCINVRLVMAVCVRWCFILVPKMSADFSFPKTSCLALFSITALYHCHLYGALEHGLIKLCAAFSDWPHLPKLRLSLL